MFSRIRFRLTFLYTVLTALALGGFALIFYFSLASVLLQEQERDLKVFATRMFHEAEELLKQNERRSKEGEREKKVRLSLPGSHVFFAITADGSLLAPGGQRPDLTPSPEVLSAVRVGGETMIYGKIVGAENESRYLWVATQLRDDGKLKGSFVVGRDLMEYDHFLIRLAQTLWGSLAVFLILAGIIGHFAAGRAIEPIRRSFETQRRFAADASHELRTPLSVIKASLDVVEKEEGARFSPLSRQIFDDLKDETRRMAGLVSDLLLLARSDAGGVEMVRKSFAIRPMVEQVMRTVGPLAESRDVKLSLAMRQEFALYADHDRVIQLLLILLDNGIKFTPSGGMVTMTVDKQKNGAAVISVEDTGVGLSHKECLQVFERFYRVDKARSREDGGAGLGLSIASWIVEAHRGKIEALPNVGGGSIFRVTLPAGEA